MSRAGPLQPPDPRGTLQIKWGLQGCKSPGRKQLKRLPVLCLYFFSLCCFSPHPAHYHLNTQTTSTSEISITFSKPAAPRLLFAALQLFIPFPPHPSHSGVHPTHTCRAALWTQVGWSWGTFGSGAVLSSAYGCRTEYPEHVQPLHGCSAFSAAFAKPPAEQISCYFL